MGKRISAAILAACTVLLPAAAAPPRPAVDVGSILPVTGPVYVSGAGMSSFPVDARNVGDVIIGFIEIDPGVTTVTGLSSSGVTWSRVNGFVSDGKDYELWEGIVGSAGPADVTISFAGAVGTANVETGFQEFTAVGYGAATTWSVDTSGTATSGTPTTAIGYPSLTAAGPGELYWGYGQTSGVGSAGSTPGFDYSVTPFQNVVTWNPSASGTLAPTAVTASATTHSVAALLTASLQEPLTAGTGYEDLNPRYFVSLVMDARDDASHNPGMNGDKVQVWSNLGRLNQRFTVVPKGGGVFEIRSAQSGKCLDAIWDARKHELPTRNGDKLQLWTCRGTTNQLWRRYALTGPGDHSIASVASGKVIDDKLRGGNGTQLQLWSYNGLPQQVWAFAGAG